MVTRRMESSRIWDQRAWYVKICGGQKEYPVFESHLEVIGGEEEEYKVGDDVRVMADCFNGQVETDLLHGVSALINIPPEGFEATIVPKKKSGKYVNDHRVYAVQVKYSHELYHRMYVHCGYLERQRRPSNILDCVMRGGSMFEAIPGDRVVMEGPFEGPLYNSSGQQVAARLIKDHYAIVQSKTMKATVRGYDHRDDVLLVKFPGLLVGQMVFMSKDFFRLAPRVCFACNAGNPTFQCDSHSTLSCEKHRCSCSRPLSATGGKLEQALPAKAAKKCTGIEDGEAYAESLRTMRESMVVPQLAVIVNARQNTYTAEQHVRLEISGQVAAAEEMAKKAIDKASRWSRSHRRHLGLAKDATCPSCKMGLLGTRATAKSDDPMMLAYPIRIVAVCNRCEYQQVLKSGIDPMQFLK
jgi:hypothetical protein